MNTVRLPHAIVIAAAMIAAAILMREAVSQSQTTTFATGIVVSSCSAVTPPYSSGLWTYQAKTQAPITMNPGGEICVSQ